MAQAIEQAQVAAKCGEVPVGAVIVGNGKVLARAHNAPLTHQDASAHAEILAIRRAGAERANYRLPDTTLYVTIEPCLMCVGAIVHARIARVVIGSLEPKAGALISHSIMQNHPVNHQFAVDQGILEQECRQLMKEFFAARRASTNSRRPS